MRREAVLGAAWLIGTAFEPASAGEVRAAAPESVAVTVYRAPDRDGRLALEDLRGFALVTETRRVTLPAGESTLRFEGVAGGMQAESALLTGLPDGVLEKNRDAALLSPASLLAHALHREVLLERVSPKTGRRELARGTLEAVGEGVVFRGPDGVEALHCSGLPETFGFEPFAGANAVPTLSVRVRSATPVTRTVSLSYLASGFDWSATYTATLSADGTHLSLGAWVTLANGNGESFRDAQTQVVAGRLRRESSTPAAAEAGGPIFAQCWPQGSTAAGTPLPEPPAAPAALLKAAAPMALRSLNRSMQMASLAVTAERRVVQEQLGDLKLYRVPGRTTLAARQMKQVRLLDEDAVPVRQRYVVQVPIDDDPASVAPVRHELRTDNTLANHLGLPLPAGRLSVYGGGATPLLLAEAPLRDTALDEEVRIPLGVSSDVQVRAVTEQRTVAAQAPVLPLLPGIGLRSLGVETRRSLEISNARAVAVEVEVGLELDAGESLVRAEQPPARRDGRPVWTVPVPAGGRTELHWATARIADRVIRRP